MLVRKTRVLPEMAEVYQYGLESAMFPIFNSKQTGFSTFFSNQVTDSEGHYISLLGQGSADIGGEFFTIKSDHRYSSPYLEVWTGTAHDSSFFRGRLFPFSNTSQFSLEDNNPLQPSSDSDLAALGTTAIARTVPTNPVVSLATFFGELREGLPKVIGSELFRRSRRSALKRGSKEFLNWEFAWKPLIADLKKWIFAARHGDKLWDQFKRDSGRRVRRDYYFPVSKTVTETSHVGQPTPPVALPGFWQGGNSNFDYTRRETLSRQQWFSGAFTYLADTDPSVEAEWKGHLQRLQHLYGVKITPDVIWNLTPWSWLIDWYSNVGDVITNLSRFSDDHTVMPYGYMMETSIREVEYDMVNVTPTGYTIPHLTQTFTTTVKVRKQATPYGFGIDLADLTARQKAILLALFGSRGKG